ncbi:MAG: flagellar biosynthesis anti-sigma factor FlgM [Pseudomonadota bacterium]
MNIDDSIKPSGSPRNSETRGTRSSERATENTKSAGSANTAPADATRATSNGNNSVQLSDLSAQLSATNDAQPFNVERVAEIKRAIDEGRFTINAEAIASSLIKSTQDMLASERPSLSSTAH